jgi:D-alanyl-D-alanine dipeptidase
MLPALALAMLLAAAPSDAAGAPLVEVRSVDPTIRVALSYAREDNAFHRRLYPSGAAAMLRLPVANRLARVQERLRRKGLGLVIWDAYRPTSVQRTMWRLRPGTVFLSNPRRGSKHSRGAAVDVTLARLDGRPLAMPTPHDEFSARARPGATRGVSLPARQHWRILDGAMRAEGFIRNPHEWWHFTAPDWARYPLSDAPVARRK